MRKEYIDYMTNLPIDISFVNISQYPIHWHDSIEILFVLKGTIDLRMETEVYTVEEKEIEIINSNEVHSIKSKDKENKVLVFHIDQNFFEKYYDDAKNVFFYTNSSIEGIQEQERYYVLRKYLSILLCEVVGKHDDYEDIVEENLLNLMFHLLNDFHYLFYEEESLRDDEIQLERYHRIVKYISNNYMNKVSLQDIAKKEFLSSQYLSYKIKNTFGRNFNDFLNLIRVEESTKLLLDTDKTISEISEEVGFSHVRYYNKHFKMNYKCTPMQYRKKYKIESEKLEKLKKITYFDLKDSIPLVSHYLEDYDRFNYEIKTVKLDIDLLGEKTPYDFKINEIIDLGKAHKILEEENKKAIKEIQKDIRFRYCLVYDVFPKKIQGKGEFINWSQIRRVFDFLIEEGLTPILAIDNQIYTKEELIYVFKDFFECFTHYYGLDKVSQWRYYISPKLDDEYRKETMKFLYEYFEDNVTIDNIEVDVSKNSNPLHDTSYMVPYIIFNHIEKQNQIRFKAIDEIDLNIKIDNEMFFGGNGLFTNNLIKKPSYYAYCLLSKLGDNLISRGEGYIVTEEDGDFQILLYSYSEKLHSIPSYEEHFLNKGLMNKIKTKFSINIKNMSEDYKIIKYDINKKWGSSYDKWVSMGKPKRLDRGDLELLKNGSFPNITFSYGKKSTIHNIVATVEEYGGTLIILKRVQNKVN